MNNSQLRGTPFSATSSGTAVALASLSNPKNAVYITDINGTSTTAGTWAILGGGIGTTVAWQGTGTVNEIFSEPIILVAAGTVSFLMNGTTLTYANISGYQI